MDEGSVNDDSVTVLARNRSTWELRRLTMGH